MKIVKDAKISRDGKYRYYLTRTWDASKPYALIIGLNPSTADAIKDDSTVTRCIRIVKSLYSFGGLSILNLFAFRATNPRELLIESDPIGPKNDYWITKFVDRAALVIVAWGNSGDLKGRDQRILKLVRKPYCLGMNKNGSPKHPGRLKKSVGIEPFIWDQHT